MAVHIVECEDDQHFEKYVRFFFTYRKDIFPSYDMQTLTQLMCEVFMHSNIVLMLNEREHVLGCTVYFVDLEMKAVIIEQTLLHPKYRGTITFIHGMRKTLDRRVIHGVSVEWLSFFYWGSPVMIPVSGFPAQPKAEVRFE